MDTIGKYKLVRVIGEGGMGRVYEAMDPVIGRRVAIKTISLNIVADDETRSRFFREAQAAGRLSHPNLITIHDIGDANGTPYIVMEFLEGMDLNHKIRQERLSYDTKMQIMIDVCEGLAFAHGHDIVHRDIKPANIFITNNGRAKILDFGLARGSVSDVTQTGKVLGTPNYMSPEQIRGDDVDHRSDIFATGVVFYELLCGRKAFEGDSIATTLYKVLETQPRPVHLLDAQLPETLSAVIDRALEKDRSVRFQTSSEMLDAVLHAHGRTTHLERNALHTLPPGIAPVPAPTGAAPAPRRVPAVAGWAVAGVAMSALAAFVVLSRRQPDVKPLPPVAQAELAAPAQTAPPAHIQESAPSPTVRAVPTAPSDARAITKPPMSKSSGSADKLSGREGGAVAVPSPTHLTASVPEVEPVIPPTAVVPAAAPETKIAPPEPPPSPAPSIAAAPPAPAPPTSARVEENGTAAVQAVLARYRAALESRDLGALKRVWPALSGRQEEAIRSEFEHSQAIAVALDGIDIRSTGAGASVTCRRSYVVTTGDGQTLRTATRMFMTLTRRDGAWSIDAIRHEMAR
ncbi:MAG: protein kinase [Acidobacteria bacterium]|nr:protein kinase [Acidobacteriota bacterium]